MQERPRVLVVALILGFIFLLTSCGNDNQSTPAPTPVVAVAITPTAPSISVTQTVQFSATVTGSSNTAVTWTASAGTIVNGMFTPPMQAGSYQVKATSQADSTKSATATVTVTAPAAQFSSAPVTSASEGTPYTYTVEAEDPAGTAVSYALTTAPVGAIIEGGVITWTPTSEQSRVVNSFAVKATTAAGGTATQTWTVTPSGIIRGSYIDKYWTVDGNSTDVPNDLSWWYIAALVPQEDGSTFELRGTGNEDGTFTISDVPAGHYWLTFGWEMYWTDSSTFDYGSDYIGRPYNSEQAINTTLEFNIFALNPQRECCYGLRFLSPNANVYLDTNQYPDYDSTVFSSTEGPYSLMPIDPEQGDGTYALQWDRVDRSSDMAIKAYVAAATSGVAFDSLATSPDGITRVEGTMSAPAKAFNLNVKGSEWSNMLVTAGPGISGMRPFLASLSVLPTLTDKFAWAPSGWHDVARMRSIATTIDQDLGTFRYVNPFPASWKTVLNAQQYAEIPVYVPGSSSPQYLQAGSSFMTDSMPTGPIAPLMSNVKNPKIDGKDFFAVNTTSGPTVTLSWDPPTGLAPFGYAVGVYSVYEDGTSSYGDLYTAETSLTIPTGFLMPGESYVFVIRAMADARANVKTSPWRSKLPIADGSIVSGPLTMEGEVDYATSAANVKAARKAAISKMPASLSTRLKARKLRSSTPIKIDEPTLTK